MSTRNLVSRWYILTKGNVRYAPVVIRLYTLVMMDIMQWIDNGHSIKKYVKIHFPESFDNIYDYTSIEMKPYIRYTIELIMPTIKDEKIIGRLINVLDKIFLDICRGDLEKTIKSNKEYSIYFNKLIKPGFSTK